MTAEYEAAVPNSPGSEKSTQVDREARKTWRTMT
jgi:hypothetical protein